MAAANGFVTVRPDARYGDGEGTSSNTECYAQGFTLPGSGSMVVTEMGIWGWLSSPGNIKLGIFTDDVANANPDSLVANSELEITPPTSMGIAYATFGTQPVLTGGMKYWIGVIVNSANNARNSRFITGGGIIYNVVAAYTWPTPAEWDSGSAIADRDYSFYAVYQAAGEENIVPLTVNHYRRLRSWAR